MFRLLLLLLGFAAYGIYSFFNHVTGSAPVDVSAAATQPAVITDTSSAGSDGLISGIASTMFGFRLLPLPDTGCSPSALPPERALALIQSLPEAQQVALAKTLNASSSVWSVQLYTGDLGTGFCLPAQDKLVLLPSGANDAKSGVANLVESFATTIPH
jgi:hypothetical protein